MTIDGKPIPEKEEYETRIHLCCNCNGIQECECVESLKDGWCYTYHKKE
jgi:hypothetical protein